MGWITCGIARQVVEDPAVVIYHPWLEGVPRPSIMTDDRKCAYSSNKQVVLWQGARYSIKPRLTEPLLQ